MTGSKGQGAKGGREKIEDKGQGVFRHLVILSSCHLVILLLLGLLLRSQWLAWQPLWEDEGYSVYFATEPLARLFWLTAHDIHPPLYYLLLHGWLALAQSTTPALLRLFSILTSLPALPLVAWLATQLFPQRPRLPRLVFILLLFSPIHLYYSQEVRMYGLALTLVLVATLCFWQAIATPPEPVRVLSPPDASHFASPPKDRITPALHWLIGYILTATLALYTIYYAAFLLAAHLFWASWRWRQRWRQLIPLFVADGLITLLYLPWLLYAAPKLVAYVKAKVQSDKDEPLSLLHYLWRHLSTFVRGQLELPPLLTWLGWVGIGAVALLLGIALWQLYSSRKTSQPPGQFLVTGLTPARSALWTFLLTPLLLGFAVNLRYPFFPQGGERLLLFVLPFLLLLLADGIDTYWKRPYGGRLAFLGLLVSALAGVWNFYTLPRYTTHDYRPLLRQVVQQGRDEDVWLATFPWQLGFWRAYTPALGLDPAHGPRPQLLSDGAVVWGPAIVQVIDEALAKGTVWVPGLMSIGSSLPDEIAAHLAPRAVNLAEQWYGVTLLRAWSVLPAPTMHPQPITFGSLHLQRVGIEPDQVAAANQPIPIALAWQGAEAVQYGVSLRLQAHGRAWANRDYARVGSLTMTANATEQVDHVALLAPVGLPPGGYTVTLGIVDERGQLVASSPRGGIEQTLFPIGRITVTLPTEPQPRWRAAIESPINPPAIASGLALLGSSGLNLAEPMLVGTGRDLTLFWQVQTKPATALKLYVSLLDQSGAGVGGGETWPLAHFPTSQWPANAILQVPFTLDLPPTLTDGAYRVIAGLIDPATGEKSPGMELGPLPIKQRLANFAPTTPNHTLAAPIQFGIHAMLVGYDLTQNEQGLLLKLYWQILQPLLPPHHIFVHLDNAEGQTLAQADGEPVTQTGLAPSGSWRPGEFLVTEHTITLTPDIAGQFATMQLRVGLYVPETEQRLPVSINGQSAGDTALLSLQP